MYKLYSLFLFLFLSVLAYAQNQPNDTRIITAVPFLMITPDARAAALAETGAATLYDENSAYMNPAKLAYINGTSGCALSYIPWLNNLAKEVNIAYLSAFHRLNNNYVAAVSLKYFSLGEVDLRDGNDQHLGIFSPSEFALDISIARNFGPGFSLGSSIRYIQSNITTSGSGSESGAEKSIAIDAAALYKKETYFAGYDSELAVGINLSNIGPKMGYSDQSADKYFLPTNLKLGLAASIDTDPLNKFTFALDFNKLLVPSPPVYGADGEILKGKDPNRSLVSGIFGSFNDAPNGLKEELKEIALSGGIEYAYDQKVFLRGGYHYEDPEKGDNRYLSAGAGFRYRAFNLDLSYLAGSQKSNALANTLRFTLGFRFGTMN